MQRRSPAVRTAVGRQSLAGSKRLEAIGGGRKRLAGLSVCQSWVRVAFPPRAGSPESYLMLMTCVFHTPECLPARARRSFLNAIATDIIHYSNQKLTYYKGDYNQFELTRSGPLMLSALHCTTLHLSPVLAREDKAYPATAVLLSSRVHFGCVFVGAFVQRVLHSFRKRLSRCQFCAGTKI